MAGRKKKSTSKKRPAKKRPSTSAKKRTAKKRTAKKSSSKADESSWAVWCCEGPKRGGCSGRRSRRHGRT